MCSCRVPRDIGRPVATVCFSATWDLAPSFVGTVTETEVTELPCLCFEHQQPGLGSQAAGEPCSVHIRHHLLCPGLSAETPRGDTCPLTHLTKTNLEQDFAESTLSCLSKTLPPRPTSCMASTPEIDGGHGKRPCRGRAPLLVTWPPETDHP